VRLIRSQANGAKIPFANRRHQFAIFRNAPNDPFGGRGQIYLCARCKCSFAVRGRSIVALDESGAPISGRKAQEKIATFEQGPCPGLKSLANGAGIDTARVVIPLRPRSVFSG
jgi:hypothetical protein